MSWSGKRNYDQPVLAYYVYFVVLHEVVIGETSAVAFSINQMYSIKVYRKDRELRVAMWFSSAAQSLCFSTRLFNLIIL